MAINPWASAAFWWPALDRQARVSGPVRLLPEDESAAYWRTRPRGSQLSATVSEQGREIGSRAELEARVTELDAAAPDESRCPRVGWLPAAAAVRRAVAEPSGSPP